MAQRTSLLLPALLLVAAFTPAARVGAQTPEPQRLTLPEGGLAQVDFRAGHMATWVEGDFRVFALGENVLIRQGTTQITANSAFVWEKIGASPQALEELTIYAVHQVRVALPEANPALYLTSSLAITFPFNVVVGIPAYFTFARWLFAAG